MNSTELLLCFVIFLHNKFASKIVFLFENYCIVCWQLLFKLYCVFVVVIGFEKQNFKK